MNAALKTSGLLKTFPGLVANDHIDFEIQKKEIVAIIGENGAGKSTFCKMLTGVYQPDGGDIFLDGELVNFKNARDSMRAGIGMVYQERSLVPMLTGAQNICIGANALSGIFLNEKSILSRAEQIKRNLGVDVDLTIPIEQLGAGTQQLIEIMRALCANPHVLILDEPTASLGAAEIEPFLAFVKKMTDTMDVSVIFISHKIEEVFEIADRIAVFTDGKCVLTKDKSQLTQEECIAAMLRSGDIIPVEVPKNKRKDKIILSVQRAVYDGYEHQLNFTGHAGEVVGLYGLVGSGRTEFAEALVGLRKASFQEYYFADENISRATPGRMIEKGLIMTPEKRADGMFRALSLVDNICDLFIGKRLSNRAGLVNFRACNDFTDHVLERNRVKYRTRQQSISELSGGNIQKIIIGRAVEVDSLKAIIVDEPTAGMDIGAKYEVYHRLREIADQNEKCVIFISSELEELIATCDCLYVFADGNIVDRFERESFDKARILETAVRGTKL